MFDYVIDYDVSGYMLVRVVGTPRGYREVLKEFSGRDYADPEGQALAWIDAQ